jgi:putative colanic acid biosynthesis acetyltransferase WcaF
MSFHNINDVDAYKRSVFSNFNKIKRFIWKGTWLIFCIWTPAPFHIWRIFILRIFGAKIGKFNFIYPTCRIWAPWNLLTEDVVTIGPGVEIYNPSEVKLSHHSILSQDAYLCGATHDYNVNDFSFISKQITIEPYVWICTKAIILPGVTCHEGSILGAASITSKDLDSWSIYAGNPSKFIKKRHNFLLTTQ